MSTKRRKAIFLDIDGTLITGRRGPFEDDKQAMKEAAGKGHFLFINTGRSFSNIPPAVLALPFLKGIAAGGGAHILFARSPDEGSGFDTIYHKWIPDDLLARIFDFYKKNSRCFILEGERGCYFINRPAERFVTRTFVPVNSFDDFKRKSSGDFITKLTIDGVATEEERLLLESHCTVNNFPDYSEGIIRGESKATAMEVIVKTLGLSREDSIAIGDGINDLDMIRFAGLGIAMGNACTELKTAANAVTSSCGKGGVAEALKKYAV